MTTDPSVVDEMFGIDRQRQRQINPPEGVPIIVELAAPSERASALAMDFTICLLASFSILLVGEAIGTYSSDAGLIILLLTQFLLRHVYHLYFEIKNFGISPGKRQFGIQIIDRSGDPLNASAIIARHFMREMEFYLPLQIILYHSVTDSWLVAAALFAWLMIGISFMFSNRDNLRIGDLVGGTMVIRVPKVAVLLDISSDSYAFRNEHLAIYGEHELQVLEGLLRDPENAEQVARVCQTICHKIGWPDAILPHQRLKFLSAYYVALRRHLEELRTIGPGKESKQDSDAAAA